MASAAYRALEDRLKKGDASAAREIAALAAAGDADAEFKTAEFRLTGRAGLVDLVESYRLIASAAARGHAEARRAHAYFTANGTGCRAEPERALAMMQRLASEDRFVAVQLEFLKHVRCRERLAGAARQLVSSDPHVEVVQGLFSPEECRYVQLLASPGLEPAMIMSASGGGMRDPHRDSDNAVITPMAEDLVIQEVNRCIAEATGTKIGSGEPLHVLRYAPGQQYRPHHDAHAFAPLQKRRFATAITYLNDQYEGGETHFPELGLRVRGATGDLLIFHNLDRKGEPDMRMTHAGLPVNRGEKWIATRWIRVGDYFGRD